MSKTSTRLALQSDPEGPIKASLELILANGESMHMNFLLPKTQAPQTIEQVTQTMLKRAQTVAEYTLRE